MTMRLIAAVLVVLAIHAVAGDNELTEQERKDGWILLFDGKSNDSWVSDKTGEPVAAGNIKDGEFNSFKSGGYVPYYNKQKFSDFTLALDVKVSKGCNSGVFFRLADPKDPVQSGFEIQVMDSFGKPKLDVHDMGALYDAVAPTKNASKPVGEWQHMEITARGQNVTVVLNGEKIVEADLAKWTEAHKNPDGTKNKYNIAWKDAAKEGYIGVQDHGHDCWYKNIKVKPLK